MKKNRFFRTMSAVAVVVLLFSASASAQTKFDRKKQLKPLRAFFERRNGVNPGGPERYMDSNID